MCQVSHPSSIYIYLHHVIFYPIVTLLSTLLLPLWLFFSPLLFCYSSTSSSHRFLGLILSPLLSTLPLPFLKPSLYLFLLCHLPILIPINLLTPFVSLSHSVNVCFARQKGCSHSSTFFFLLVVLFSYFLPYYFG